MLDGWLVYLSELIQKVLTAVPKLLQTKKAMIIYYVCCKTNQITLESWPIAVHEVGAHYTDDPGLL